MPAYESELDAFRALLPKSGKGLEIGVGTGRFAAPLGLRFGLDPAKNMVRIAVNRGVEVILGAAENLPFRDGSLEILLMVTTVCFLNDPTAAFREAYRVLGKDGHILVGFIDRESLLGKSYEKNKKDNIFYREASFLSSHELALSLKEAGFRDFVFRQTIFGNPTEMRKRDPVKTGYGEGSFVVVRGRKAFE